MNGIYLLLINMEKDSKIKIGSLGFMKFDKGTYAYVGSAQNNLEKRIARHKSKNKKIFWHIDYLLNNGYAKILKVFYKKAGKMEECKIAKRLCKTSKPIFHFGCSDCNCKSHLFRIKNQGIFYGLKEYKKI